MNKSYVNTLKKAPLVLSILFPLSYLVLLMFYAIGGYPKTYFLAPLYELSLVKPVEVIAHFLSQDCLPGQDFCAGFNIISIVFLASILTFLSMIGFALGRKLKEKVI